MVGCQATQQNCHVIKSDVTSSERLLSNITKNGHVMVALRSCDLRMLGGLKFSLHSDVKEEGRALISPALCTTPYILCGHDWMWIRWWPRPPPLPPIKQNLWYCCVHQWFTPAPHITVNLQSRNTYLHFNQYEVLGTLSLPHADIDTAFIPTPIYPHL